MNYLLDTHAFVWWAESPTQLSSNALEICRHPDHRLFLSMTSIWEMQIKLQLGKLKLQLPLATLIKEQQQNRIELLEIRLLHILELDSLPNHHKDPFDRLLVAQARIENLILLTHDPIIAHYPVQATW